MPSPLESAAISARSPWADSRRVRRRLRHCPGRPGIRLAVKDLFDTAGLETTYGSGIFAEHVPSATAPAVACSRRPATPSSARPTCTSSPTARPPRTRTSARFRIPPRPAASPAGRAAARRRRSRPGSRTRRSAPTRRARSGSRRRVAASSASSRRYGLVSLEGCWPLAASFDTRGRWHATSPAARAARAPRAGLRAGAARVAGGARGRRRLDGARRPARAGAGRGRPHAFPRRRGVELPFPDGPATRLHARGRRRPPRALRAGRAGYGEDVRIKVERCLAVRDAEVERAAAARARVRGAHRARRSRASTSFSRRRCRSSHRRSAPADRRSRGARVADPLHASRSRRSAGPRSRSRAGPRRTACRRRVQLAGRPGADALVLAAGRLPRGRRLDRQDARVRTLTRRRRRRDHARALRRERPRASRRSRTSRPSPRPTEPSRSACASGSRPSGPASACSGEEFGRRRAARASGWILDPIDATKNYVRGIPIFATLIALEDRVAVVSAPALGKRWWAVARREGAFADGRSAPRVARRADRGRRAHLHEPPRAPTSVSCPRRAELGAPRLRRLLAVHAARRGRRRPLRRVHRQSAGTWRRRS